MVMETFGRLGPESEKVLLNLLAMAAGHHNEADARAARVARQDAGTLWFATADAVLQALGRAAAPGCQGELGASA